KNNNIDASLFTILATSYGLSIQLLENEIHLTPIKNVFDHLPQKVVTNASDWHNEHGLADT
ncbi:MAG: hypothetical protein Q7W54_17180, partial [Bacteroidota bacterium]|nr:hypothetical protein [Bacteroidota bacterium]